MDSRYLLDYEKIGLKVGLEIHQQLDTETKLFCRCPVKYQHGQEDYRIIRHMRPTLSEMGEYDRAALMEFRTKKNITYLLHRENTCTYEMDDTPPFPLNEQALDIALRIATLLDLSIVDEVHISRKQYLDGSIPTGFQRTAVVGINGKIPYEGREIKITHMCLEEDACREVWDEKHSIGFRTDRLGTPLVEVITAPDMHTPEDAMNVARELGWAMRHLGIVRRGIGATRQDVNVSINGGRRVEIKGVDKYQFIRGLVAIEAYRQKKLLDITQELKVRGLKEEDIALNPVDYTDIAGKIPIGTLENAVKSGGVLKGLLLPKFHDILNIDIGGGRLFSQDFAGRVRVIACLDDMPNIAHTDEEVLAPVKEMILERAGGADGDVVMLVWGPEEDVKTALEEIRDRAKEALDGVPNETRQVLDDLTTDFERILPGSDRMYPDTDLPPIVLDSSNLDTIKGEVEAPWSRLREYMDMGLDRMKAWNVLLSSDAEKEAFMAVAERFSGPFAYHIVFEHRKGLSRKGKEVSLEELMKTAEKTDKKGLKAWMASL